MDIRVLREFEEFSKHMNFSATARYLHMSQSALSKHIAELERELGFELVHRDRNPALTPAGLQFLLTAQEILYELDIAVEKCRHIAGKCMYRLTVHDPLIDATIGNQAIPVFVKFAQNHSNVDLVLRTIKGETVSEALRNHSVDVGYLMAYGDVDETIEERRRKGIVARPMRNRRFSVWMSADSPLAQKEKLYVEDLEDMQIFIAADRLFDDWRGLIDKMCRTHGFVPKIKLRVTPTINGYLAMSLNDGVILLSDAFTQDPRFLMRTDMTARIIEDAHYTLFYVVRENSTNPAIPIFVEEMTKQVADEYKKYA